MRKTGRFSHSVDKYLLSAYSVPSTVLGMGNIRVNKIDKSSLLTENKLMLNTINKL